NRYGVYAFGIGARTRRGRRRERTLVVYIVRKLVTPKHRVPPISFRHGGRTVTITPDVVATGGAMRACDGTDSTYTGLHAGAAIAIGSGGTRAVTGGIACLIGRGDGPTHLLTAGHLFPPGAA